MGGVQNVVLGGVGAGFMLYVLAKVSGDMSKAELLPPMLAAALPALVGGLGGSPHVALPGGRLMTPSVRSSALSLRRRVWGGAAVIFAIAALVVGCLADARPSLAQGITFPDRPKPVPRSTQPPAGRIRCWFEREVINYDYTNERVSASRQRPDLPVTRLSNPTA